MSVHTGDVHIQYIHVYILYTRSGAQLGNFERGRWYICYRKDEIIHCLSPSIKCVAALLRDMSLAKV